MFRHLCTLEGVVAHSPPQILFRQLHLSLRGYLARVYTAIRFFIAILRLGYQKRETLHSDSALLVYGHQASTTAGKDAYFGNLLIQNSTLSRVLHIDCSIKRVLELECDGRTISLHRWGKLRDLISLPFVKWRPGGSSANGKYKWLIKRAATLEGATGQAASLKWQIDCQARWLRDNGPKVVVWPWENHSWEREFVRQARACKIRTLGYQHSVIGQQMINYSPRSNTDDMGSIPDKIICTGQVMTERLISLGNANPITCGWWGIPISRHNKG